MDCRTTILCSFVVLLTALVTETEGRNKKVVIHVPFKVKKMKHTHTIFNTIHHHHTHQNYHDYDQDTHHDYGHHTHHDHGHHTHHDLDHHTHHDFDHGMFPFVEHDQYYTSHIYDESPKGGHSRPLPDFELPEFLPDEEIDESIEYALPKRRRVPPYNRL